MDFKILLLVFRAFHGKKLAYTVDLLTPYSLSQHCRIAIATTHHQ